MVDEQVDDQWTLMARMKSRWLFDAFDERGSRALRMIKSRAPSRFVAHVAATAPFQVALQSFSSLSTFSRSVQRSHMFSDLTRQAVEVSYQIVSLLISSTSRFSGIRQLLTVVIVVVEIPSFHHHHFVHRRDCHRRGRHRIERTGRIARI